MVQKVFQMYFKKQSGGRGVNLLGMLSLLIAACSFTQMHMSMSVLQDDNDAVMGEKQRHSTRQRVQGDSVLLNDRQRSEVKKAVTAVPTAKKEELTSLLSDTTAASTSAATSSSSYNMTHEIFFAPSSIQEYASPVVPEEERQWLEAKRNQWPPKNIPTLPLPIFVLNLPKSGTQSIFDYFAKCGMGKHWIAHYWIQRFHSKVGRCLADNVWADRPMAQGCGEAKLSGYAVFTDSGLMWSDEGETNNTTQTTNLRRKSVRKCFFPGIHGLENIAKYYPTATILHFPRNATQWVESSSHWNHLLDRYDSFCGGFPEVRVGQRSQETATSSSGVYEPKHPATTPSEWVTFYEQYTQHIRDFAKNHPSLTYLERPLEDMEGTARFLEEQTGISASCYTRSHVNKKRRKQTDQDGNATTI